MRSHDLNSSDSTQELRLPEPDPANITVLTKNLPNNPILPWNHFDSPWLEPEGETLEPEASEELVEDLTEPETEAVTGASQATGQAEGLVLDAEISAAIAPSEPSLEAPTSRTAEGDRADS